MTQNKKNFIWNTLGSGLNSFNSLFFMIIVTRINGIKDAGIFSLCFATACMFYIIAIYSGRTYQVTETDENITDNEYITHRFLSSIIMIVISVIWGIFNGYNTYKITILLLLCLFKVTEAISDVFYGIMQKNERLDLVGISLFIKGILNVIIFFITNYFTRNLTISCISLIFINTIIIIIFDIKYVKKYKEKRIKKDCSLIFRIFTFGFYTFLYTLISNYLINIPRYAIDNSLSLEYQTIYSILVMPASIIMLANMFIFQPVITKLKAHFVNNKKKEFIRLTLYIIFGTIIIGVLSTFLAYHFGIEILNIIYNLSLNDYLEGLILIIIGATIYTTSTVISNCLVIIRKTKIQVLIYTLVSVIAYILSNYLVKDYGILGGVYTYVIMMLILLFLYIITYIVYMKLWKHKNNQTESSELK